MKRTEQRGSSTATAQPSATANDKGNGHGTSPEMTQAELGAILAGLQTMRDGDFSVRLPGVWTGVGGKIADTFNEIVIANQRMANELARVGQVVGKEGRTKERPRFYQPRGAWGEMEASVNTLIDDLLRPTTEVTRAIAAVAQGNLAQTVRLDVDGRPLQGEFLRLANIVNTMIQQLSVFTAEVTRVAREVGTEGKLGGQAKVPGVAGTWKDLTECKPPPSLPKGPQRWQFVTLRWHNNIRGFLYFGVFPSQRIFNHVSLEPNNGPTAVSDSPDSHPWPLCENNNGRL